MDLDDLDTLRAHDPRHLLAAIDALPDQLEAAWARAEAWPLSAAQPRPTAVVLAAVGSGALAAEIVVGLLATTCPVPLMVWSQAGRPACAGPGTLVLALRSAEPEAATTGAAGRGASEIAIDDLGEVPGLAATGSLAVLLLALLTRLGLAAISSADVTEAVAMVRTQRARLRAESPVSANPAKRMAGQLMDRLPLIFAAAPLAAVARYWKSQINRVGRAPAAAEAVPDLAYLGLAGTEQPENLVRKFMVLALRSRFGVADDLTAQCRLAYMTAGFNTDEVAGVGPSPLAHVLTAMHYGDYAAYYLAHCYGVDPSGE